MAESEHVDTNDPRERVRAAMADISGILAKRGVKIITRISVEQTSHGDRAIVDSEWAVAAIRDWPPKGTDGS